MLLLLGSLDSLFVSHAYHSTIQKGPTVQLVFGFEYAILWTIIFNTFLKYVLHTVDLHRENPWENKAVYLLYSELIISLAKVLLYTVFMTIMIRIHAFPLFAIRPMYLSIRAMKKAVNDVIHSRRAIRNMNTLYPDATAEELRTMDNVCIICREEMTAGGGSKKLPCNHIFHAACLRSWFQRQQTCPTCRMDVLRTPAPPQPQAPQPPAAAPAPPPAPAPPAAAAAAAPWNLLPPLWPPMSHADISSNLCDPGGAAAGHPTGDSAASSTTSNNNNSSTTPATGTAAQPTLPPFPFLPICKSFLHWNPCCFIKDRNKEGGGLAFLIKNLYYEDIAINIPNTSDLEAQEISNKTKTSSIKEKFWNFKKANWNLYQQNTNEDFKKAPTSIKDLEQNWISFKNTIIKAAKVSIPRAPPPPPSPELRSLSEDELRAMEGQERAHLEARIRCLRNIQTLLDAATLQMQQYSTLVAAVGNSLKPVQLWKGFAHCKDDRGNVSSHIS
ncbi:SYVN1 [Cordylochernes scorpioides]|uniref:RING-type E3 ubiquitin transferase n=1 Tax=Cordylochernes scorpioides TaxID=51811 RepID=A0ABY6K7L4_9ARAC|nr:SYVN1 [Cordylochernes scorpioides]